jgi:hypothetical protein
VVVDVTVARSYDVEVSGQAMGTEGVAPPPYCKPSKQNRARVRLLVWRALGEAFAVARAGTQCELRRKARPAFAAIAATAPHLLDVALRVRQNTTPTGDCTTTGTC